jgi:hypothetical protein
MIAAIKQKDIEANTPVTIRNALMPKLLSDKIRVVKA